MDPHTLVIFDFSGTLSLSAVAFGRPDRLQRHLEMSGLAAIGIGTVERYWQGVVNPTWETASRSAAGFKSIAAEYIVAQKISKAPRQRIEAALSRFVDAYLQNSRIEPEWRPLLAEIQQAPDTMGLIATDHYAEASPAILKHLDALGIKASPAGRLEDPTARTAFIVANSADIGCLKADPGFWQALQGSCLPGPLNKAVLVDDFGQSEQADDGYAQPDRIARRMAATQKALRDVLRVEPRIIPFRMESDPATAIAAAAQIIREALQA